MKKFLYLCLLTTTFSSLQGCLGASAAATGAQAVYNKQTLREGSENHLITMRANRAIYIDTDRFKETSVSISAFHYIVLLTGQVATQEQREEIGEIVKNVPDVEKVYNFISVGPIPSPFTQMHDSWITSKIKSQFIASADIDPNQIKVVTENGMVYLMGILPHEQADIAVDIAKSTSGVKGVVKIFSYIRITKD